jgi:hypothetical protein
MSWLGALVATSVIYLAPLMVGATPFLVLYWLYQPTMLASPQDNAYRAPAAIPQLPPVRRLESLERNDAPAEVLLADTGEPAPQAAPDEDPKNRPMTRSGGPIRHGHNPRIGTSVKPPAPAWNVQTAINDPGQRAGRGARSAANAYALAQDGGSYHGWRYEPSR